MDLIKLMGGYERLMKVSLLLVGIIAFYQYGVGRNEDYVWGGVFLGAVVTLILMEKYNRFLENQNLENDSCTKKELVIFFVSQIIVGFVLTFLVFSSIIMVSGILQVDDRFLTENYPINFWLIVAFGLAMIVDSIITLIQLSK